MFTNYFEHDRIYLSAYLQKKSYYQSQIKLISKIQNPTLFLKYFDKKRLNQHSASFYMFYFI